MQSTGIHIRVSDILHVMLKHRVLILALTIGGLVVGLGLSGVSMLRGEMRREYSVEGSFVLTTQNAAGLYASGLQYPNHNDATLAKTLMENARLVLSSDALLDRVVEKTRLIGVTAEDIRDNLTLTQRDTSQIFRMTLYWRAAEEGISILNALCEEAPAVLQQTLGVGGVSILNPPKAQYLVGRRSNITLWGLTTILGFMIGMGITLMELILHPTLRRPEDVDAFFEVSVLAEIPSDVAFFRKRDSILSRDGQFYQSGEMLASAAYAIQTYFRKSAGPHIFCVTSALRGEGKTALAANLAVSLAELSKRVLLVDFDLTKPELANLFMRKPKVSQSLNALYNGECTAHEAVVPLTAYLDLLPTVPGGGAIPLEEDTFQIVRTLAQGYDYVLIDTQPVGLFADVMRLSQLCTAALFVIQYDMASMQEIRDALGRIDKANLKIMGAIVNGVKVSKRNIRTPMREREELRRAVEREKEPDSIVVNVVPSTDKENSPADAPILASWFNPHNEEEVILDVDNDISSADSFVHRLLHEDSPAADGETPPGGETPSDGGLQPDDPTDKR